MSEHTYSKVGFLPASAVTQDAETTKEREHVMYDMYVWLNITKYQQPCHWASRHSTARFGVYIAVLDVHDFHWESPMNPSQSLFLVDSILSDDNGGFPNLVGHAL